MANQTDTHKRGAGFLRVVVVPADLADGYFAGWTVACQVRNAKNLLVDTLDTTWEDSLTTRNLQLRKTDTTGWPVDQLFYDVQFTRPDGWVLNSGSIALLVERDITQ